MTLRIVLVALLLVPLTARAGIRNVGMKES